MQATLETLSGSNGIDIDCSSHSHNNSSDKCNNNKTAHHSVLNVTKEKTRARMRTTTTIVAILVLLKAVWTAKDATAHNCLIATTAHRLILAGALLLASSCLLTSHPPGTRAAPCSSYSSGKYYNHSNSNVAVESSRRTAATVWPTLPHVDIWSAVEQQRDRNVNAPAEDFNYAQPTVMAEIMQNRDAFEYVSGNLAAGNNSFHAGASQNSRKSKVIHLFPVPVDGECLSDDGRRIGNCFNAYECRSKGGTAKGECAMGFGVCCIFIADCNTTISNNNTYLLSPQFPSFMPNNYSNPCSFKVQMMNSDISQLRLDFYHFSLGQPNRRNGVCDGDVFNITGGPAGIFTLCGLNSGQHIYYDVGGTALPRQTLYGNLRPLTYSQLYPNLNASATTSPIIEINMNFRQRFLPIRLWEIRISQIPFSQRAPVGCLQYYTGTEGIIQTFNFADNGRHLANQHYRICMRQETEMCSIMYQPCDEQSFRIGPSTSAQGNGGGLGGVAGMMTAPMAGAGSLSGTDPTGAGAGSGPTVSAAATQPMETTPAMPTMLSDDANLLQMMSATTTTITATTTTAATTATGTINEPSSTAAMTTGASSSQPATAAETMVTMASATTAATAVASDAVTDAPAVSSSVSSASTLDTRSSTTPATVATSPLNDDIAEGSGDSDDPFAVTPSGLGGVSRRPRPVRGGFDLLGFLRSAFDFASFRAQRHSRQLNSRQLFSRCTDRLTMPCIIEDFISMAPMGAPVPGCEPVHCGAQFCSSGVWPCRAESTVTPFYIGVHFGDGAGKGSAEDNIGACLRYAQVQCM